MVDDQVKNNPLYHRFLWFATFQIKMPVETFPRFPSIIPDGIPYMAVHFVVPASEQFENSQMYEDLKIEGLNYRISRKSQSPCSSKASNGLQQSQSIDC